MVNKSWDDVLLEERESNSRLRAQQRDQAERERRLVERLAQLKEQQQALQQGKTVDAVGRDGKIKALQVGLPPPSDACAAYVALHSCVACLREQTCALNRNSFLGRACAGPTRQPEPAQQGAGVEAPGCEGGPPRRRGKVARGVAFVGCGRRCAVLASQLRRSR